MPHPPDAIKIIFIAKFKKASLISDERCTILGTERYQQILEQLKALKQGKTFTNKNLRRLSRYNVEIVSGEEILTEKHQNEEGVFRKYCRIEEMPNILEEYHARVGHCRPGVMDMELKKKYANINRDVIKYYLRFCDICVKYSRKGKRAADHQLETKVVLSKGKVEVLEIDLETTECYKFVLIYVDCSSNFTIFKAMKTHNDEEIADKLVDIFCLFPVPNVLQSTVGRYHAEKLIKLISFMLPDIKIVHGEADRSSRKQLFCELLYDWMSKDNSKNWPQSLRYIQVAMNEMTTSLSIPYQSMFGVFQKMGLKSSNFTKEQYSNIETEEELIECFRVQYVDHKNALEKDDNTETNIDIDYEMRDLHDGNKDIAVKVNCVACGNDSDISEIFSCEDCERLSHVTCAAHINETEDGKSIICIMCTGQSHINDPESLPATSAQTYPVGTKVIVTKLNSACIPVKTLAFVTHYDSDSNLYKLATKQGDLRHLYKHTEMEVVTNTAGHVPEEKEQEEEDFIQEQIECNENPEHEKDIKPLKCKCVMQCTSKKCSCRQNNRKCTELCHNYKNCFNK